MSGDESIGAEVEKSLAKIERILSLIDVNVGSLTASKINDQLDRLDRALSLLTDVFIASGRGEELPSETFELDDPLAILYRRAHNVRSVLSGEVSRRYGPGAPGRLPTRRRKR